MVYINIATTNLQSGVSMTKGGFSGFFSFWKYWLPHSDEPFLKAGEILKGENVDIVGITEISEKSLRTGFRSQAEILKNNSDMNNYRFFSTQKFGKLFFHEGKAIFSKYPITNPASHLLYTGFMRTTLDESTIEVEGKKITFFIVHLALLKKHRDIQIKEIIEIIKKTKGPIILMGDFNERDPRELDVFLQETSLVSKCTLKTFPSWNPRYMLDNVFLSKEFNVLDCYIPKNEAFSDHLPLIVKAELK